MALRRIVFVAVMLISIAFPISSIAVACDIKGDFRCEDFWKYQFDLGYEFVSIDKMFQEAFPRTGLQFFIPMKAGEPKIRNFGNRSKTAYIGLTATVGGKKTDDNDDVEGRYYGGLRFALDTDHYFDVLGGFTERTDSTRLELRGQMPIAKIKIGEGGVNVAPGSDWKFWSNVR